MKIVATIEARMTSSRLPGKVLLPANSRPMLYHLVQRLKRVESVQEIVLATTINAADDPLVEYARKINIAFYRGSEDDVMLRVIGAAESVNAEIIVEITGDCPIIDPLIVEQTIQMYLFNNDCDYVSNAHVRSYPDGMDTQVFRLSTLKKSAQMTNDALEHEHVTLHIRKHPEVFRHLNLVAPPDLFWPELGLTLDEQKDYLLLKSIIEYFGDSNPYFTCKEVIQFLKTRPDLLEINKDVVRKGDT